MKNLFILTITLFAWSCSQTIDQKGQTSVVETDPSAYDFRQMVGQDFLIDDQHSYIGFKIKYFGFSPVRGRFDEFDGTVFYDPDDPSSLSVSVFIDASSINTGNERRDNDLTSDDTWFDTKKYPYIVFQSVDVTPRSDGSFDLIGDLTIKGITKRDTIAFGVPTAVSKDWAGNDQVDFSGRTVIDRQAFNVFGGDFWSTVMENGLTQLSDEVEIEIDIHARRADYQIRYDQSDSLDPRRLILDKFQEDGLQGGMELVDLLVSEDQMSSGILSTVGYTLQSWGMFEASESVFLKRLELYPERTNSWNQLGINSLYVRNEAEARDRFSRSLDADSADSRAAEYLRLIEKL